MESRILNRGDGLANSPSLDRTLGYNRYVTVPSEKRNSSNLSVRALAGERDPIEAIQSAARAVVLQAAENGWSGPPFDPFALAELRGITVVPLEIIADARTVPVGENKLQIQFNPNRPQSRIRYSICHEIAHTLFPDCGEKIRNRSARNETYHDDWELEMLCNIGAAELLMPIGSFEGLEMEAPSVDRLLELRQELQVSTEAIFLRSVRLSRTQTCLFSFSRHKPTDYRLDYSVCSGLQRSPVSPNWSIPVSSVLGECTAIGWTAKGEIPLPQGKHSRVECVGIPPYPGQIYPRVLALLLAESSAEESGPRMQRLVGNAVEPRGQGRKIIAQVVNDRGLTWGAGFGLAVRKKWPQVQEHFRIWASERGNLRLGNTLLSRVSEDLAVFHMVAQHGYGPSPRPRIRYGALQSCLNELSHAARQDNSSVHMPRIGCGEAGGSWHIVGEMIKEALGNQGTPVTIYDLSGDSGSTPKPKQLSVFDSAEF